MYKNILCPVDGSATSNYGLREAIQLAKVHGAKLRLFHVIDTYVPIIYVDSLPNINVLDILQRNAETVIETAGNQAKKAGVMADTKIAETLGGNPAEEIVKEAGEWPADIIVMGTHGLRGLNRLVMGSDAENIVRTSPVPVMLLNASKKKANNTQ